MCVWLLTACFGLLPTNNQVPVIYVPAFPSPILIPTAAPTTITAAPTVAPTAAPTMAPTAAPTMRPTAAPTMPTTAVPTMPPTAAPTMPPTAAPTMPPTAAPTMLPTAAPTMPPTAAPTMPPTAASTMPPTAAPTLPPTAAPTMPPTAAPTMPPTAAPTMPPTAAPTMPPTAAPTMPPTAAPTMPPTAAPTMPPTAAPTMPPTAAPTMPPTAAPTAAPTMAPPATTGGESLSLVLCNDPDLVCVFNPDETLRTGSLPIDPRLGTTPSTSAAYQQPITGYNAQVTSYDSAVRFPRERRAVSSEALPVKDLITERETEHRIRKRATCTCVPAGTCKTNVNAGNSGAGMIDVRIVTPGNQCPTGQEYCCDNTTPAPPPPVACGVLQTVPTTGVTPTGGQANFGQFPWQGIVLTKQNDYLAGGVLIDALNVLTVTHRLVSYVVGGTAPNVKVRLGEWDAGATYEPVPFQEYNVLKVFTHPSYVANTLQYDVTVLRLAAAVPFTPAAGAAPTINRACLPPSATAVYNGQMCMVAGWGKNMFGMTGQYQAILKRVDVPMVPPAMCQTQLQAARLGASYVLDTTSFVCAGGAANADACTGDGGSGLVCPVNGAWVLVGLVAWGLGCGAANVPAAYVNVAGLLPWIQAQVATP